MQYYIIKWPDIKFSVWNKYQMSSLCKVKWRLLKFTRMVIMTFVLSSVFDIIPNMIKYTQTIHSEFIHILLLFEMPVQSQESERPCLCMLGVSSQESERPCLCVLGVSRQESERPCLCMLGVSSQESERSCLCMLGVSSQESERPCLCMLGVSILSLSTIFLLDFGNVPTASYFLLLI
jgi:hypothetical protein